MGKRQRSWAKAWKHRLRLILGMKCACCGAREQLEFDCIKARSNGHARREQSQRVIFYREQWRMGNLQLLCKRCNLIKGDSDLPNTLLLREVNSVNNYATDVPTGGNTDEYCE